MTVHQFWAQAEDYTAADDRLAIYNSLLPGPFPDVAGGVLPQSGVRHAGDLVLRMIDGSRGEVGPGAAFIGWAGTTYALVSTEREPVEFAPSDPVNARIDRVIARVHDSEAGGPDQPPAIEVVAGQPAQTPVPPALPPGSLGLHQVRYNAGSNAPIITDDRPGDAPPVVNNIESFTDLAGEVWVRHPTVNAGLWRRARDVLHARWSRMAPWVSSTAQLPLVYDTPMHDPYGIYTAPNAIAAIPGLWRCRAQMTVVAPAAGHWMQIAINANFGYAAAHAAGPWNTTAQCEHTAIVAAGVAFTPSLFTSVGMNGQTGPSNSVTFDYLGTG